MKNNQELRDKYIERLSKITLSIKTIYDNIINSYEKDINKQKEYLLLAEELEDSLYKEIEEKNLSDDLFFYRINYLVKRNFDENDAEFITTRILQYLAQKEYLNPFLSQEYSKKDRLEENIIIIKNQVYIDYIMARIIVINEILSETNNKRKIKKLLKEKYQTLAENKIAKNMLEENNAQINGRNRCIIFNQDKELVTSIYREFSLTKINESIYYLLNNINPLVQEIELRSSLKLLTKGEILSLASSYSKSISPYNDLDPKTDKKIRKIIRNALLEENNNIIKKKK